ncbi:MAG: arylamine N-acetyltransferase family protein [Steroidobacteraceae bacterium]
MREDALEREPTVDLEAYLRRIGHSGSREPTLETLRTVHALHPQAIPFENLDPYLGRAVPLDLASLERKLVREGRGGWCFEHNLLFAAVLRSLGFRVTGLAARVVWNAPAGAVRPRGHMLLRIDMAGEPYVADVGFGGLTLTAPLRLVPGTEQPTPHEPFRLIEDAGMFVLQALVRGEWRALYRFDLQPQLPPDYEVASWYLSTHPASHFVQGLMVARVLPGRRLALANRRLSVHRLGGTTEHHDLASVTELRRTLEEQFGLRVPAGEAVDSRLERLFTAA